MKIQQTSGYKIICDWLSSKGYKPFSFQEKTWQHILQKNSGLVNAPTGCGKTFSIFLGSIIQFINNHPNTYLNQSNNGLQLLWITPLRALAKDIGRAMEEVLSELNIPWKVGVRNGDTNNSERQKQKRRIPEILIITPESLHLLLAKKKYSELFRTLQIIAVDEWHELLDSKRGVQVELAISRIIAVQMELNKSKTSLIWGISATIGNLKQGLEVLLSPLYSLTKNKRAGVIVKASIHKNIQVESILPDVIEKYPWAGHLGIKLIDKVLPIIYNSSTTLIFINTRGMSEIWYQALLNIAPDLAGAIALHHGSIERELRNWVEETLHTGKLKVVICTASLDLGVDFRPVETVIQVGSPKGVARFLQRAGRSGHTPNQTSKIYFLPTHSLELVEAAALKTAIQQNFIESRQPRIMCFDVLVQYLCTLAISEGFNAEKLYTEIKSTYCYREINKEEWNQVLHFLTTGGNALQQYDEYKKVEIEDGIYTINNRRIAMRHRLHIGTIVSDPMLNVKYLSGGYIGVIEEWFISKLKPGDVFTLAGRNLELFAIKDLTVMVKTSTSKNSRVPSWIGGRLPLSKNLGEKLREKFNKAFLILDKKSIKKDIEINVLKPLFELQEKLSHVPKANELLIEHIQLRKAYHLFVYPYEGRLIHESLAAVLAYRISKILPISFSFAMNEYGFELLSDQPIPVDDSNVYELFSPENLFADIQKSVNATEMAKHKFRDIAVIGGLVFQGYPGEHKKARHLQSSASLLFKVFNEYDPNNLLVKQAYQEVFEQQMQEQRLRNMLERIQHSKIVLTFPSRLTPFCFPIKVDSLRENLSSEKLEDRVRKMQLELEKNL